MSMAAPLSTQAMPRPAPHQGKPYTKCQEIPTPEVGFPDSVPVETSAH